MTTSHTPKTRPAVLPALALALAATFAVAGSAVADGLIHAGWEARMQAADTGSGPHTPRTPRGSGDLQLFASLAEFQDATAGWGLVFEDFSSRAPNSASPCYEPANSDMGQPGTTFFAPVCFEPGVLAPGFSVRSNLDVGAHGHGLWVFGAGIAGLPVPVVGTQSPASTTLVDFHEGVVAVAMDAFDWQAGTPLTFVVLGAGGRHLGDFTVSGTVPSQGVFAGFISAEPVHRVEVRSLSGATQMISNLRFGGQPGGYTASGTDLHFGTAPPGGNALASVWLEQTGDLPVQMPSLPAPSAPFVALFDDCSGEMLAPGDSCEVTYSYEPHLAQSHRQELPLPLPNGAPGDISLRLTGRGVSPHLHLDGSVLAFGDLPAGQQATASVVVSNHQAVQLQVDSISPVDAPFTLIGGADACPPAPFDLEPGEACRLTYQVTVTGPQADRARVLINSNDPSTPRRLLLKLGIDDRIFSHGFEAMP